MERESAPGIVEAWELSQGDLIALESGPARVERDAETLHRGWSAFDELELLVGVPVVTADSGDDAYLVLNPRTLVRRFKAAA